MTVASLPMYDLAAVYQATNQWWEGLARAFRLQGVPDVPDDLSRGSGVRDLWKSKDLIFSQTCGYPLINSLKEHVRLLLPPAMMHRAVAEAIIAASLLCRSNWMLDLSKI